MLRKYYDQTNNSMHYIIYISIFNNVKFALKVNKILKGKQFSHEHFNKRDIMNFEYPNSFLFSKVFKTADDTGIICKY